MRKTNALQQLIESCLDNERLLRHESGLVDSTRRPTLKRLADERHTAVDELRSLRSRSTRRRGSVSGSWFALLRELRRNVRVALGGRNSGDAVAACRRSMSRAEALYDRAVVLPLPEKTVVLLLQQRNGIRLASVELKAIQF